MKTMELCPHTGHYSQLGFLVDAKQRNVAQFKRGFCGEACLCMWGIKLYSKFALENDLEIKIQELLRDFFGGND